MKPLFYPSTVNKPLSTILSPWYIYDIHTLQVRRSSKICFLAKDQILRQPLVYLGLIELSPFSPQVHRRQVFSTLVLVAPPVLWYQSHEWRPEPISAECWIWLEPHLQLLMHDWKAPLFSITFRSQPLMGFPVYNEKPLRLTFRSFCKANSWPFL